MLDCSSLAQLTLLLYNCTLVIFFTLVSSIEKHNCSESDQSITMNTREENVININKDKSEEDSCQIQENDDRSYHQKENKHPSIHMTQNEMTPALMHSHLQVI